MKYGFYLILASLLSSSEAKLAVNKELKMQPFTIALLPDTQHYTTDTTDLTYMAQVRWIMENRKTSNIKFVIHLGDITQHNTASEWRVARRAHDLLDRYDIPYTVVPGNHDNPQRGKIRDTGNFNKYFGPQTFQGKSWYKGHAVNTNDNNYSYFFAGNMKFLVIGLEFAPRNESLEWANSIIINNPSYRIIIVTHCYQGYGGSHFENCTLGNIDGNSGSSVWEKLVSQHKNIFLVLSGHVNDSEYTERKGKYGNRVHEILTDYQSELKNAHKITDPRSNRSFWAGKRYGNGWMRVLKFNPKTDSIYVETFTVNKEIKNLNFLDSAYGQTGVYSSDPFNKDHRYMFHYSMK